jgi:hypothetical protein
MRIKMLIAAAAITVSGVLATGASAANLTPTKVTIQAESGGDFFGFVKSSDKNQCAANRKVTLYRLLGTSPNPGADQKVGMDLAQANGNGYMWSTGNTGERHGKFYARVKKTETCAGDISSVVKAQK